MSYLLLHNGNQLVKPWAKKFYNCIKMPCLIDPWPGNIDLSEKYLLAKKKEICTDLTTADKFDVKNLFDAKHSYKIVKIITSYENDIANLEPLWDHGYNKTQWLESTFCRLSIADSVIFHQSIALDCLNSGPDIVFTPGRSGTHVLMNAIGISRLLHHNNNLLMRVEFNELINAQKIASVLRKKFVDQVISDAINNAYGTMLTTADNLADNQKIVNGWAPLTLSTAHYQHTLEKIFNYADLLLGIKMCYNKKIEFSLFEELKEHFSKISYLKNPYRSEDIISNYAECVDVCENAYQPIYDQLINKLQCVFNAHLYL